PQSCNSETHFSTYRRPACYHLKVQVCYGSTTEMSWLLQGGKYAAAVVALSGMLGLAFTALTFLSSSFDARVLSALDRTRVKVTATVLAGLASPDVPPQELTLSVQKMLDSSNDWRSTLFFVEGLRGVIASGYSFAFDLAPNGTGGHEFHFVTDPSR